MLDWAMKENSWGVVDINLLAHLPTVKGQAVCLIALLGGLGFLADLPSSQPDRNRDAAREKVLAGFIWDSIARLSAAQNIVLFGSGAGCSALMEIVRTRGELSTPLMQAFRAEPLSTSSQPTSATAFVPAFRS